MNKKTEKKIEVIAIKKQKGGRQEGAGRPPKAIVWEQFEQLCALQCTNSEICAFLKINVDTLRKRAYEHYHAMDSALEDYSAVYKRYADAGKCSLRRNQFVLSKKNAAMAIFLGKQWLGQSDEAKEIKDMVIIELREGIKRISEQRAREAAEQSRLAS